MELKTGDVYLAKRDDIVDIKDKFQLYLSDDYVLLINTNRSKKNVSPYIKKSECKLLSYDSYICIDTAFIFDPKYPVIKKEQVHPNILKNLITYLPLSVTIPKIKINEMIKILQDSLTS